MSLFYINVRNQRYGLTSLSPSFLPSTRISKSFSTSLARIYLVYNEGEDDAPVIRIYLNSGRLIEKDVEGRRGNIMWTRTGVFFFGPHDRGWSYALSSGDEIVGCCSTQEHVGFITRNQTTPSSSLLIWTKTNQSIPDIIQLIPTLGWTFLFVDDDEDVPFFILSRDPSSLYVWLYVPSASSDPFEETKIGLELKKDVIPQRNTLVVQPHSWRKHFRFPTPTFHTTKRHQYTTFCVIS